MSGGERRPLWAGPIADEPRHGYEDVVVRVLEEEPEELPPPPPPTQPSRDQPPAERRSPAPWLLTVLAVVGLTIALEGRGSITIVDVPSFWGDVPMTCHTVRVERDEGAVEWFRCRAVGGRPLPAGVYRSPESQWTSDITRRDARESRIRIWPDGDVVGWARY
jgi:hypothetical protein